jgi:hemerythrin-like domain-containing protein
MTHNPITIIKDDHKRVSELFREYKKLGESAVVHKREIVDEIIKELTLHAEMEETICYPRFKEIFNKDGEKMVEEAIVEHQGVKTIMKDLKTLDPSDLEFDARTRVLIEQVEHHVDEEESRVLPEAEQKMSEDELDAMAHEMMEFKESPIKEKVLASILG